MGRLMDSDEGEIVPRCAIIQTAIKIAAQIEEARKLHTVVEIGHYKRKRLMWIGSIFLAEDLQTFCRGLQSCLATDLTQWKVITCDGNIAGLQSGYLEFPTCRQGK